MSRIIDAERLKDELLDNSVWTTEGVIERIGKSHVAISDSELIQEARRRGIECADVAKPPLGLIPRWLRDERRLAEIEAAMNRYREADKSLPEYWIEEFEELETRLKSCHGQMAGEKEVTPEPKSENLLRDDPKDDINNFLGRLSRDQLVAPSSLPAKPVCLTLLTTRRMDTFGLDPSKVANYFTCTIDREAGDSITHLKLQKLLYYTQAWSMVHLGKTLFDEDFQAWTHGPVLRSIYDEYSHLGFDAIPLCDCDYKMPKPVSKLMEDIKKVYGEKSAKFLEDLTHSEAPWIVTRGDLPLEARSSKPISKELMLDFYTNLDKQTSA